MAQGCILPVTARDTAELRASLKEPQAQRTLAAAGMAVASENAYAYRKAVSYPLSDPDNPAHKVFVEYVLRNVAGNESISDNYRQALPRALVTVAEQTPDILGLATPSRGKGASALAKTLGHRTRGDAFAYELLGTAEVVRMNNVHNAGYQSLNGGPELRIFNTDRLDLGVRFQASYWKGGEAQGLFRPTSPRNTNRDRETFEADLLIRRGEETDDPTTIGVDFKHARHSGAYAGNPRDFRSQIQGVVNGILTGDMFLKEFHYVTNGCFNPDIREAVEEGNNKIIDALRERGEEASPRISLHERVQFPLR